MKNPRVLLERVAGVSSQVAKIAIHEYVDYATWRAAPPCAELEEFVAEVSCKPVIEALPPTDSMWPWLRTFIDAECRRLVDLV